MALRRRQDRSRILRIRVIKIFEPAHSARKAFRTDLIVYDSIVTTISCMACLGDSDYNFLGVFDFSLLSAGRSQLT